MSVLMIKCNCRTVTKNGKRVPVPEHEQPPIAVYQSIDPRFLSGTCIVCGKQKVIENKGGV